MKTHRFVLVPMHFQRGARFKDSASRIRRLLIPALAAILASLFLSCADSSAKSLQVWTYDSFVSEWGPGAKIAALFKEKTGLQVEFVSKGDGGALLAALLDEGKKTSADLIIGLDDRLATKALASDLFSPLDASILDGIPSFLQVDPKNRLVPYDYGNFAFIWDSESATPPPASLEDLTLPAYKKKIILMDPRTSTPGLGFLAWTEAVYGERWEDYWSRLAPNVLALTPGWDTGYGLFTKGEAPLVLSYSTSPAYHKAYEASERYKALVFPEGHSAQIELAGALKSSRHRKDAERFIAFLLSEEGQSLLPETQWMYPANAKVQLPESFSVIPAGIATIPAPLSDPEADPAIAARILVEALR